MRDSKIKCQNMLRLREKRLVDKLQEIYEKSQYGSINEFLNACLKTIALFFRPINVKKHPVPPLIAHFKCAGIACMIAPLTPVNARIKNKIPAINTAASPALQLYPSLPQMVVTNNAVTPRLGASAIG